MRLPRRPLRTCPRLDAAAIRSRLRSSTGENLGILGLSLGLGLGLRRAIDGLLLRGLRGLCAPRCHASLASVGSDERRSSGSGLPHCEPVVICSAAATASAAAALSAAPSAAPGAPGARGSTPAGGGSGAGSRNEVSAWKSASRREEAREEAWPTPTPISDDERGLGDVRPMPVPSSFSAAATAAVAAVAAVTAASTAAPRDVLLREMERLWPSCGALASSALTPPSQSAKRLLVR